MGSFSKNTLEFCKFANIGVIRSSVGWHLSQAAIKIYIQHCCCTIIPALFQALGYEVIKRRPIQEQLSKFLTALLGFLLLSFEVVLSWNLISLRNINNQGPLPCIQTLTTSLMLWAIISGALSDVRDIPAGSSQCTLHLLRISCALLAHLLD